MYQIWLRWTMYREIEDITERHELRSIKRRREYCKIQIVIEADYVYSQSENIIHHRNEQLKREHNVQ